MHRHYNNSAGHPICQIIPPIILRNLAEKGGERQRELAFRGMQISAGIRGKREAIGSFAVAAAVPAGENAARSTTRSAGALCRASSCAASATRRPKT